VARQCRRSTCPVTHFTGTWLECRVSKGHSFDVTSGCVLVRVQTETRIRRGDATSARVENVIDSPGVAAPTYRTGARVSQCEVPRLHRREDLGVSTTRSIVQTQALYWHRFIRLFKAIAQGEYFYRCSSLSHFGRACQQDCRDHVRWNQCNRHSLIDAPRRRVVCQSRSLDI